uniref:Uncharacterized protein n=1 Tax=Arundo donax TaxID=35708 RepID=A0A0A9CH79_ARUDO
MYYQLEKFLWFFMQKKLFLERIINHRYSLKPH